MSITLAVGAVVVELPHDLYWSDEFAWSAVEQSTERSITGALLMDIAATVGGRPITLGRDPGNADMGWLRRDVLEQLQAWANTAGLEMTLTLRGVARTVMWRHQDGNPIDGPQPVMHYSDVQPDDKYRATLRFMEL